MKVTICGVSAFAVLAAGVLVGCSTKVPMVYYHNGLAQKKVQALKHWDLMAREVADKIAGSPDCAGQTLAVIEPDNASAFLNFFNQMVKTELLRTNVQPVETANAAALTLHVHTQLVRHEPFSGSKFSARHRLRFGDVPDGGVLDPDVPGRILWGGNPVSLAGGAVTGTLNIIAGQVFGTPRETASELLVLSVVKQDGVPKMAVKQIVYVDRDEAIRLYWQPAKYVGTYQPPPTLKVTAAP